MKVGLFFLVAFENMWQHKLRTFLTLLGLIVGISAVLLMTGLGRGLTEANRQAMSSLLPNKLTLRTGGGGPSIGGDPSAQSISMREVRLLEETGENGLIMAIAPVVRLYDVQIRELSSLNATDEFDFSTYIEIVATTADFAQTENLEMTNGRFFLPEEVEAQELVAVVNQTALNNLIQPGEAPPTTLTVGSTVLRIVGVTESDNFFGGGFGQVWVPISLLRQQIYSQNVQWRGRDPIVEEVSLLAADVEQLTAARREVEQILRLAYGLRSDESNSFSITGQGDILESFDQFSRILTAVLGGIGAVSLVVGGIGIMNIMLATITERTREIGIRKAIGASETDVLMQFVVEAITICISGALLAVALCYGISFVVDFFLRNTEMGAGGFSLVIDSQSIVVASGCGIVCGVIFGLYPALRAMRLDPIDALRTE